MISLLFAQTVNHIDKLLALPKVTSKKKCAASPTASLQQVNYSQSALVGIVDLAISLSFGLDNDEEIHRNFIQINGL